jgi:hypothetical protein
MKSLLPLNLYPAHKRELLSTCLWKISEADGKHKVRYWSVGAINAAKVVKLHHEHVVERSELVQRLLSGESVEQVAEDVTACMVTPLEHEQLGLSTQSGWDRYRDCSIGVYDSMECRWLFEPDSGDRG